MCRAKARPIFRNQIFKLPIIVLLCDLDIVGILSGYSPFQNSKNGILRTFDGLFGYFEIFTSDLIKSAKAGLLRLHRLAMTF